MSGIHTFVVRTAVKAGMYTLPSRQHFLAGIGEPGERRVRVRLLSFSELKEVNYHALIYEQR